MTSVVQTRFISLSRFPELKGKDPETIQNELAAKYGSESGKVELLDGDTVAIQNS